MNSCEEIFLPFLFYSWGNWGSKLTEEAEDQEVQTLFPSGLSHPHTIVYSKGR